MAKEKSTEGIDSLFDQVAHENKTVDVKSLDETIARIDSLSTSEEKDEAMEVLLNVKLSDLQNLVKATEKDLQTVVVNIQEYANSIGEKFDSFGSYNEFEKGLIEKAKARLASAEGRLEEAKTWSDLRNMLFGWKDRAIEARQKALSAAEKVMTDAEAKAELMFNERLASAEMDELLEYLVNASQNGVNILREDVAKSAEVIETLKGRRDYATDIKKKASEMLIKEEEAMKRKGAELEQAEEECAQHQANTPERAEAEKKAGLLKEEYATIRANFNSAREVHNSKTRFLEIIITQLDALINTKGNMQSLMRKLRSDTEERVHVYQGVMRLIQAGKKMEINSTLEQVGVKVDEKTLQLSGAAAIAVERDSVQRQEKEPERQQNIITIREAFNTLMDRLNERSAELYEEMKNGYGKDNSVSQGEGNSREQKKEEDDLLGV